VILNFVFGILALFFLFFFFLFFGFFINSTTFTDMTIIDVKTDLPLVFLDSHRRGDDDFTYYQFDLQSEKPLHLQKVFVYNKNQARSFGYFEVGDYHIELQEDSYCQESLEEKNFQQCAEIISEEYCKDECLDSVELDSKASLLTRNTLAADGWSEDNGVKAKFYRADNLNVLFRFKEGIARVKYRFSDREERYTNFLAFSGALIQSLLGYFYPLVD
jgi:voltage-gated potassium channel Kch